MRETPSLKSEIAEKMDFEQVRYSQVWEDHLLLERGLQVGPGDDVLSICSGGCNALALLLMEPHSVTTIDMNPAQSALLELKLAGIRVLSHPEFACLVGARQGHDRLALFSRLKSELSDAAVAFWESTLEALQAGLIHSGRLETYLETFRQEHLSKLWSEELMTRLFAERNLGRQAEIFRSEAATPAFEECFRWYFGREKMAEQGRDPAQFEHVTEGDVGAYFFARFCDACTRLPLHDNFYMESFLTAKHRDLDIGPPYLRPRNFERLKSLVDRVNIYTGELETYLYEQPPQRFSKANLSDIFEYMSPELSDSVFQALASQFRVGGRIAYWNLLVPRSSSATQQGLRHHDELSARIHRQDRSWFYRSFHVESVEAR